MIRFLVVHTADGVKRVVVTNDGRFVASAKYGRAFSRAQAEEFLRAMIERVGAEPAPADRVPTWFRRVS